ncbi:response regulator transcription factor [Amycolatopsis decaplanina]|uniref:Response regulator receiver protein n=1 Tax=Amycolatopsis decaplanina DSM 44594 TaxID=1284240 RepID=M2X1U3_9PSEU|nr:response regulator transcription factor [Amycolatopsis decaplanina]EME54991.1 response regulator receiver protein [Amycolatopsis decaplanina DSM 44594]
MIKVVVAGGDEIFRVGICSVLKASGTIEVAAQTGTVERIAELVLANQPDVVVIDLTTKDQSLTRTIRSFRCELPATRVVVIAPVTTNEVAYFSLTGSVAGLLEGPVPPQELINVITAVASGDSMIISPSIAQRMTDRFLRYTRNQACHAQDRINALTPREREVLAQVAKGYGNAEIAHRLYVSEGAVKAHVSHLLTKLGCANRVQAAIIACDSGLFELEQGQSRLPSPSPIVT